MVYKTLNYIYKTLENKINNYIEIVDDIEYFDSFVEGIIVHFSTGECLQVFYDIDNKINDINNNIIVLDENLNIKINSNNINYIINNVISIVEEKNKNINNNINDYIIL